MFRRGAEALWLPYAHALDMGVLVDEALADGPLDQPASELEPFGARGWRGRGSYFTPWTLGAHPGPTMMRRPPKGGTSRPAAARPGYGFGRPLRPDRNRTLRRTLAVIARLQEFAAERGISVSELAVAWTLANPMVDVAIVGAGHPRHLDGIIGAGDFRLSHRDLAQIDRILREPT
jgi:aryl-alcohol dehydrogenase-like predicted oxidoreductase